MNNPNSKWAVVVVVLFALGFFGIIIAGILSFAFIGEGGDISGPGNVAIIPLKGVILTADRGGMLDEGVASSTQIVEWIEKASENPDVRAIVLEIDSGGGAPVASDEIASALKRTNKTTVAWIREMGASGAYWVASACDHIVANRMSMTGSIGVRGSYLEFSGLLERYNVTYQELFAGKFKESGSPFRKLSESERDRLMGLINDLHREFITQISENRQMPYEKVRELATGEVFLGADALSNGLIDELGGFPEVKAYLEDKLGIDVHEMRYTREASLIDVLRGVSAGMSHEVGKGIGDVILEKGNGGIRLD